MKALFYLDIGELELRDIPVPEIGDGDALVKVARAGICGSDVTAYTKGGGWVGIMEDGQFGHEMVGSIVDKGKDVTSVEVGDRVWVNPMQAVEEEYLCDMLGAFAEYVPVMHADQPGTLYRLPDELTYEDAVLIEPFGVATHAKNLVGATADKNVLIHGAGPIGMLTLASLVAQGSKNVAISEVMAHRAAYAQKLGAAFFDASQGADIDTFLREHFGSIELHAHEAPNVDCVIDCVGMGQFLTNFLQTGRSSSSFITIGLNMEPVPVMLFQLMSKQLTLKGSRGYAHEDIVEVIDNLTHKKELIADVISHEFSLDEYDAAFKTILDRNRAMKVVFNIGD